MSQRKKGVMVPAGKAGAAAPAGREGAHWISRLGCQPWTRALPRASDRRTPKGGSSAGAGYRSRCACTFAKGGSAAGKI